MNVMCRFQEIVHKMLISAIHGQLIAHTTFILLRAEVQLVNSYSFNDIQYFQLNELGV